MKARQVQAQSRHQSCQALHKFQQCHPEVRDAVAPGAFQFQLQPPARGGRAKQLVARQRELDAASVRSLESISERVVFTLPRELVKKP